MREWIEDNWLKVVAIVVLLGALAPFPYVYYQLMNWIVAGAAVITANQAYKQRNEVAKWVFLAVAVIFNPVAPLHLRADVWMVADIIAALLFAVSFWFVTARRTGT